MSKEKNEVNVLDELNKGACMGMDAIHFILDKVDDKKLENELGRQYREYKEITEEISELYPEYAEANKKPHETNSLNKAMTWYGIEVKTLLDTSNSKIAELLLKGTNMGIIEGRKLLNHKDVEENIALLIQKFIDVQEKAVLKLKEFL